MTRSTPRRGLTIRSAALPEVNGAPLLEPLKLEGEEGVNQLFEYRLVLQSAQVRAPLELNSFIGRELTCCIELEGQCRFVPGVPGGSFANQGAGAREISGLITQARYQGESGRHALVELTLRPWLHLATLTTDCKVFQDQSAVEIIEAVLGEYTIWNASGITSGTTGTHTVQATSHDFLPGKSMPVVMPGLPQVPCARLPRGQMLIERRYADDAGAAQAPYRVRLADGSVREGRLDNAGRALLQEVPQGAHEVSIGEDAREWRSTQGDDPLANPAYGSRPDASQSLELYRAVLGSAAEEVAS